MKKLLAVTLAAAMLVNMNFAVFAASPDGAESPAEEIAPETNEEILTEETEEELSVPEEGEETELSLPEETECELPLPEETEGELPLPEDTTETGQADETLMEDSEPAPESEEAEAMDPEAEAEPQTEAEESQDAAPEPAPREVILEESAYKATFPDVRDKSQYFYNPIYWAVEKGIAKGFSDGTFRPYDYCTRGQAMTFIWRMAGSPSPKSSRNPFRDLKSTKGCYKAVLWAVEKGITTGYTDGTFRPDAPCERKHVMTFLWRYAGKPKVKAAQNAFKDVSKSDYFYDPVRWGIENGITTGYTDGTFRPTAKCQRRFIVTFLYRFKNKTEGMKTLYADSIASAKAWHNSVKKERSVFEDDLRYVDDLYGTFYDMTGDGVPDLIVSVDLYKSGRLRVYSFNGKTTKYLGGYDGESGELYGYGKGFLNGTWYKWYVTLYELRWTGSRFNEIVLFDETLSGDYTDFDGDILREAKGFYTASKVKKLSWFTIQR